MWLQTGIPRMALFTTNFLGLPTFCKEEAWNYLNTLGVRLSHKRCKKVSFLTQQHSEIFYCIRVTAYSYRRSTNKARIWCLFGRDCKPQQQKPTCPPHQRS